MVKGPIQLSTHMNQPTQEALISDYIQHTNDMQAQDAEFAKTGIPRDIARYAMAKYGAADAAKALHSRFGIDVEHISGLKQ